MEEQLRRLKQMIDNQDPSVLDYLEEIIKNSKTEEDKKRIEEFASGLLRESASILKDENNDILDYTVKQQMGDLGDALNFAYIARHYFGKSKAWLYQRMKGNIVNGKHAQFTREEKETFNNALKDISNRLESAAKAYA